MSELRKNYRQITVPDKRDYAIQQTKLGNRFNAEKVFSNVNTSVPLFLLFENPIDSGVTIQLQERKFKSDSSGITDFQILWDYDVSTATKSNLQIFNQDNRFVLDKIAKAEVSVLNTVSIPDPDEGNWAVTGAAIVADVGIEREPDFIPTSGQGNNTSGDISPALGVRDYAPGTGFLTRIITDSNDNRVLWGYDWFEISL